MTDLLKEVTDTKHIKELTSDQIKELQRLLVKFGHDVGEIDGIYGNNTLYAFNSFKEKHNLTHPNFIGKTTIEYLYSLEDEEETKEDLRVVIAPREGYTVSEINWSNFNSPIGKYFTVGELLRYDKARIPTDSKVKSNILKIVKELDKIREAWGKPIGVTSGYRPLSVNRRVGGARYSQHLTGNAVDIFPIGGNIYEFQKWLDTKWYGALGYGASRGFVHIDIRNSKGFQSSGSKGVRWNY